MYRNIDYVPMSMSMPIPTSPQSQSTSRPAGKRKQVKNACINCQKACKKCDDTRPCGRCVKYGTEETCIDSQRKERRRKGGSEFAGSDDLSDSSLPSASLLSPRLSPRQQKPTSRSASPLPQSHDLQSTQPTRWSSRSRQPFSRELLDALRQEELAEVEAHSMHSSTLSHSCCGHEEEHVKACNNDQHHSESRRCLSDPDHEDAFAHYPVSDEFRALAKLCSDLHMNMNTNTNTSTKPLFPSQGHDMAFRGFASPRTLAPTLEDPSSLYVRSPMPMPAGLMRSPSPVFATQPLIWPGYRNFPHISQLRRPFGISAHTPATHPALYPIQHFRRSPLPLPLHSQQARVVFNQTPPEELSFEPIKPPAPIG